MNSSSSRSSNSHAHSHVVLSSAGAWALMLSAGLFWGVGCGDKGEGGQAGGAGGDANADMGLGDGISLDGESGGANNLGGNSGQAVDIYKTKPQGFTENAALDGEPAAHGGWMLVGPVVEGSAPDTKACANILRAITRDMSTDNPDFGHGDETTTNIVTDTIGSDRKPVFKQVTNTVHSKESFDQWYRNVDGINSPYYLDLWLEPVGETYVFDSGSFFPLDSLGLDGEDPKIHKADDGEIHRFLFTTELHTQFKYKGGENFTFRGDDDVFVYIDGKLAVNLGGIHGPEEGSVDLDDFAKDNDLTVGEVYDFDLFQAERKPTGSNFRIETTLDFSGCSVILPGDGIK